jgi:proline-rich protein PRCC
MDSLLASYASSDEEEEQQQQQPIPSKTTSSSSSSSSLFSILPQPKSSSLFNSLPPPKQSSSDTATDNAPSDISSLPKPKSQIDQQQQPKRVVQFKPPIIPLPKPTEPEDEEDEDDEEEERIRRRKLESSIQAPSVKSFLSTIPAPRNSSTLGVQSTSGSGRRSILETSTPAPPLAPPTSAHSAAAESNVPVDQNAGDYENYQYATDQYGSYGNYQYATHQYDSAGAGTASNGDGYASYGAYEDYGQYENKWIDRSVPTEEASEISESVLKFTGKRGRKDVPVEVIEVKQDELMKNRPREDKAKLTGIAFGPSYQVFFSFLLSC